MSADAETERPNDLRYLCTKGHHVVSRGETLVTCPAVLPWPPTESSRPCGAQLSLYRYEREGDDD